jgi:hypothetical protein
MPPARAARTRSLSSSIGRPGSTGEIPTDMQVSEPLAGRFGLLSVEAVTCISVDFSARTTGGPFCRIPADPLYVREDRGRWDRCGRCPAGLAPRGSPAAEVRTGGPARRRARPPAEGGARNRRVRVRRSRAGLGPPCSATRHSPTRTPGSAASSPTRSALHAGRHEHRRSSPRSEPVCWLVYRLRAVASR